jgi:hypothetical protein
MSRIPLAACLSLCFLADYAAIAQVASPSRAAGSASAPAPKLVTLIEPVETEYGLFGRGRQMSFVEREGNYVRVRYLDHEALIPVSSTDLPRGAEAQIDAREELAEWLAEHGVSVTKMTDEKLIPEEQARARETLKALRETVAKTIQEHHLSIGMTAEECRLAWGPPSQVNRTLTGNHESEQWIYRRYPNDHYLYLDDGILTSIQD